MNIMEMIDFTKITACGECCAGCKKKENGLCEGCIESDGHCKEWAESGQCPIHKCAREHGVQFCGLCSKFPCGELTKKIHWNPNIVEHLTKLANGYWVKDILKDKNLALIGFADLSEIDADLRYGFKYGICIAMVLEVFPSVAEPSMEYYNEYRRLNRELRNISNFLADAIKERGLNAYSLAGERQNEDFRTQLPFKTLATRAGVGWIGKSAALITKQFGNAIRLNGVLTDMPLETETPINSSLCGDCEECVKHCPGKAITGNSWSINADRNDLLNAQECKKTVIERGKIFDLTEGTCGICLTVCPWTKKYMNQKENKK